MGRRRGAVGWRGAGRPQEGAAEGEEGRRGVAFAGPAAGAHRWLVGGGGMRTNDPRL